MNIKFINLPSEFQRGAERICKKLGILLSDDGIAVYVNQGNGISVTDNGDEINITYNQNKTMRANA